MQDVEEWMTIVDMVSTIRGEWMLTLQDDSLDHSLDASLSTNSCSDIRVG
jgi:hypothetical protein